MRPAPRGRAVRRQDLRTGQSPWQRLRVPSLPVKPLRGSPHCDVLVVGAGISGALITESLSDAGLDVIVVDRRGPVRGSTPASTALLQYEIDLPLHQLARRIGRERAERIWRRSRLALDALRERTRHLGIDADLVNRDSLYLEGDTLDATGLQREGDARRRAGFESTYLTRAEVRRRFGIPGRAALLGYDNLAADPRRLATGFLRVATGRGARLLSPVDLVDIEPSARGVVARTAAGQRITATRLVFATGYELPRGVPRRHHSIASTWALATRPQRRRLWPTECFVWEASDPYLYARTTPDGRVICGGEDESLDDAEARDALLPAKIATIGKKLQRLFPDLDVRPDFAWCGFFGASDTGTPSIGPVPGMPGCYAALGYGGNGITFSMMAAQLLTGMILGRGDPDADLVSFGRKA